VRWLFARSLILALLGAGLLVGLDGEPGASASQAAERQEPRTLYSTRAQIYALAQDGSRMACAEATDDAGCDVSGVTTRLLVRTASGGQIGSLKRPGDCGSIRHLALAGQQLIWTETGCGNTCQDLVMTAAPGGRARVVKEHFYDDDGTGERVLASGGDSSTFLYLTSSAVYRVRSNDRVAAVDRGAWTDLALASGRVALLPATVWGCVCNREPSWGADGRIYFASRREGADWELFGLRPDGKTPARVTDTYTDEASPDLSRSGRLLFVRDGQHVMARTGRGERRLTHGSSAAWSPDASLIALERNGRIVVLTLATGALAQLGPGRDPQWSPDGTQLVFHDDGRLVIANRDGTGRRRLVFGSDPSWSANDRIAFAYGDPNDDDELYTVAPDGSGLRQLTDNGVDDLDPDWSPDGTRLVFVRDPDPDDEYSSELYVLDADSTRVSRLAPTKTAPDVAPAEVRSVARATSVSRLQAPGKPIAVGLSRSLAALLVSSSGRKQIFLYRPASGRRIGIFAVPPDTLPTLSVTGSNIVFQAGKSIMALDTVRRTRTVLALTSGRTVGLSVEGQRVAWAEHTHGTSRIRAVYLRS
jgi:WD40-like Beta Propeller Repeat